MKRTALFLFIAVFLVAACGPTHEERLAQLEQLEQWNRADSVMRYDSLALLLTDYFDSHGTSNERLRAHYILGRTYADLGESPRALDCYHDALSYADTTATDCDYKALVGIHGQMAVIFHQQNLTQDEIRAISQYIHCMQRAYPNDTLRYLLAKGQLVRPYYLMGETDTVLQIIECINKQLEQIGHQQEAARGLGTAIYIYTKRGQIAKAKQLLAIYEQESNLFDAEGNIAQGREDYYWIKGLYEIAVGQIDSAEYYFRKGIQYGGLEAVSSSYKGMLSVYQHKHNLDSVVYYSRLNEAALDSLHNRMQTDAIHQASALYDYTRSEKEAEQERLKAKDAFILLGIIIFVAFILLLIIFAISWLFRRNQKEKKKKIARLEETLNSTMLQRSAVQDELRKLKEKDYEGIIAEKERQEAELTQTIKRLQNNLTSQEANALIEASPAYQRLQSKAGGCAELTDSEWQAIEKLVKTALPGFYSLITSRQYSIRQEGRKLCFLLRLHVGLKEASVLMGISQPNISKLSKNILSRVFGEEGSGKELIKRLEYIF